MRRFFILFTNILMVGLFSAAYASPELSPVPVTVKCSNAQAGQATLSVQFLSAAKDVVITISGVECARMQPIVRNRVQVGKGEILDISALFEATGNSWGGLTVDVEGDFGDGRGFRGHRDVFGVVKPGSMSTSSTTSGPNRQREGTCITTTRP